METFTVLSIGIAAALRVLAGVMLVGLRSAVDRPALAAGRKRPPQHHRRWNRASVCAVRSRSIVEH